MLNGAIEEVARACASSAGLWEGSTQNATLVRTLLADFSTAAFVAEQAILFVTDSAKALRSALHGRLRRMPWSIGASVTRIGT